MSISNSDCLMTIFFNISYQLVPKIEVCLKYFLDKKSQKAPIVPYSLLNLKAMTELKDSYRETAFSLNYM